MVCVLLRQRHSKGGHMGNLPQEKSITVEFESQFRVTLASSEFAVIMKAFLLLLPQFLEDFFQKVLVAFAEYEMSLPQKSLVAPVAVMTVRLCGRRGMVRQPPFSPGFAGLH